MRRMSSDDLMELIAMLKDPYEKQSALAEARELEARRALHALGDADARDATRARRKLRPAMLDRDERSLRRCERHVVIALRVDAVDA